MLLNRGGVLVPKRPPLPPKDGVASLPLSSGWSTDVHCTVDAILWGCWAPHYSLVRKDSRLPHTRGQAFLGGFSFFFSSVPIGVWGCWCAIHEAKRKPRGLTTTMSFLRSSSLELTCLPLSTFQNLLMSVFYEMSRVFACS